MRETKDNARHLAKRRIEKILRVGDKDAGRDGGIQAGDDGRWRLLQVAAGLGEGGGGAEREDCAAILARKLGVALLF